jgi:hypothetical protein
MEAQINNKGHSCSIQVQETLKIKAQNNNTEHSCSIHVIHVQETLQNESSNQ